MNLLYTARLFECLFETPPIYSLSIVSIMKKYLLILGLSLSATLAFSQNSSLGPNIGINSSWLSDQEGDIRNPIGLNIGLNYVYSNYEKWGFGTGLNFSQEGVIVKRAGTDYKTQLNYLRIPLKAYHFFGDLEDAFRPKIYVGPSFGFLLGGKAEVGDIKVDSKDNFEGFDVGAMIGTGFNFKFAERTWFNFDLAYTHGLINASKLGNETLNRNVGVTMGVAWGF